MLTLEEQQRSLQAVVRGNTANLYSDRWQQSAAASPRFRMMHAIALWWQRFQIEWQCRYTSRLMKRLGCFESYLEAHFLKHPAPPSTGEMTAQFLSSLQRHEDPLLRAVASLELACIKSKIASAQTTTIFWDRDPNQVMDALDRFARLPDPEPKVRYILRMGAHLPDGISCKRQVLRA